MHTMATQTTTAIHRSPPRHIRRPPSATQKQRRDAFRRCVHFWHTSVGLAHSLEWQLYAERHPITNRRGKLVYLTAWSAFLKINLYRAYSGVSLLVTPPPN